LKEDGRMALVLPATVLRIASCEGIRKMLVERYDIEYIVTTWQRTAFSEAALFREILLVAKKRNKAIQKQPCTIIALKNIPRTSEESLTIANRIRQISSRPLRGFIEDEAIFAFQVSQQELRERIRNLFPLIAFKNKWLVDFWEELVQKAGSNLIPFRELLSQSNAEINRGIETSRGGKVQSLTITQADRAIKKSDVWVVRKVQDKVIVVENRFTQEKLNIPHRVLCPALRRVSFVSTMDISDNSDYVVVADFQGIREFLKTGAKGMRTSPTFWNRWRSYVEGRLSRLALVRRTNISAPGTYLLAFYSSTPFAPPGVAWSVNVSNEQAKLLCLWLNSTINLLQVLLHRKETGGAFLQLDEYVLEETLTPDFSKIEKDKIIDLLTLFDELKDVKFPSILEQLEREFSPRVKIDKAFLKVLGLSEQDIAVILPKLYASLVEEIKLLKQIMAGTTEEEEDIQ
jgi:hypothetical protein